MNQSNYNAVQSPNPEDLCENVLSRFRFFQDNAFKNTISSDSVPLCPLINDAWFFEFDYYLFLKKRNKIITRALLSKQVGINQMLTQRWRVLIGHNQTSKELKACSHALHYQLTTCISPDSDGSSRRAASQYATAKQDGKENEICAAFFFFFCLREWLSLFTLSTFANAPFVQAYSHYLFIWFAQIKPLLSPQNCDKPNQFST